MPPTRGKGWKAKKPKAEASDGDPTNDENGGSGDDQDKLTADDPATDEMADDNLRFVTEFVDESTDIDQLMAQNFPAKTYSTKERRRFGIVGLHTCGSLATSSIKIFLAKDGAM